MADEELAITYEVEIRSKLFRVQLTNRRSNGGHGQRVTAGQNDAMDWSFRVSILNADGIEKIILAGNPLGVKDHANRTQRPVRDPFGDDGPLGQLWDVYNDLARSVSTKADELGETEHRTRIEALSIADELLNFASAAFSIRLSLLSQGGRFDEALGVFATIVGSYAAADMPDRGWVYLSRADEVSGGFVPDELIQAVEALPKDDKGSDITLTDASLPFLKRTVDLFGGQQAKMVLRLQEMTEDGSESFRDFEFLFTLDDGTTLRHDLLSWGQKRMLSFFYYAASNPDVLVIDELVNGLHHEWIAACLKEMEGRQCFLTSQNPLLLDHLTFSSAEDVRRTFIQCRREKGEKRAELHWRPIDEASAESFFRAYRVGIQHVGELLRTKGLW
jgi:AAA domain, putative AbiEii toxin, Type IV TA system